LALQLISQGAAENYDPSEFKDEEKSRVLAAIDEKVAGGKVVAAAHPEDAAGGSGQVIDLMAALQASLGKGKGASKPAKQEVAPAAPSNVTAMADAKERKTVKRTPKAAEPVAAAAPAPRSRAKK